MVTDLNVPRKRQNSSKLKLRVWKEVFNMLGSEFVSGDMSRTEFRIVVQNHVDRFPEGGLVRNWLAATPEPYSPY